MSWVRFAVRRSAPGPMDRRHFFFSVELSYGRVLRKRRLGRPRRFRDPLSQKSLASRSFIVQNGPAWSRAMPHASTLNWVKIGRCVVALWEMRLGPSRPCLPLAVFQTSQIAVLTFPQAVAPAEKEERDEGEEFGGCPRWESSGEPRKPDPSVGCSRRIEGSPKERLVLQCRPSYFSFVLGAFLRTIDGIGRQGIFTTGVRHGR